MILSTIQRRKPFPIWLSWMFFGLSLALVLYSCFVFLNLFVQTYKFNYVSTGVGWVAFSLNNSMEKTLRLIFGMMPFSSSDSFLNLLWVPFVFSLLGSIGTDLVRNGWTRLQPYFKTAVLLPSVFLPLLFIAKFVYGRISPENQVFELIFGAFNQLVPNYPHSTIGDSILTFPFILRIILEFAFIGLIGGYVMNRGGKRNTVVITMIILCIVFFFLILGYLAEGLARLGG